MANFKAELHPSSHRSHDANALVVELESLTMGAARFIIHAQVDLKFSGQYGSLLASVQVDISRIRTLHQFLARVEAEIENDDSIAWSVIRQFTIQQIELDICAGQSKDSEFGIICVNHSFAERTSLFAAYIEALNEIGEKAAAKMAEKKKKADIAVDHAYQSHINMSERMESWLTCKVARAYGVVTIIFEEPIPSRGEERHI